MKLTLSQEVLDTLPEPDKDGIVRVTAGLKLVPDTGEVMLVELNDVPVDASTEDEPETDEAEKETPSLAKMADEIYGPQRS